MKKPVLFRLPAVFGLPFLVAICCFLISFLPASSQLVTQTESFESTIFPAPGWTSHRFLSTLNGNFIRQSYAGSANPTVASPAGGSANAMMFNSYTATAGDSVVMISKPYDFSNCGGVNPVFSFSMYRDNGFAANNDRIQIYINSVPSFAGATLLTNTAGSSTIPRYSASFPAATANTWNYYTYNLSAAAYNNGPKKTYILILGIAADGNNIYMDNFQVNTYPSPAIASDVSFEVFQQNINNVGLGTTDNWIIGIRCIISGNSGSGVTTPLGTAVKLDSLALNTNGTTSLLDIQNAKVWYTGGSSIFSTAYISPYPAGQGYAVGKYGQTISVPGTNMDFIHPSPCFHLEYDTTYFWLTYDVKSTATAGNLLDAELRYAIVSTGGVNCPTMPGNPSAVTAATTTYSLPGEAVIDIPYCIPVNLSVHLNNASVDFVQRVEFLNGESGTYINTHVNSVALQNPLSPCYPNCPYVAHPPDYEFWDAIPGQYVIITQGLSYNFRAQGGTWSTGNYVQAWIDYNRNGIFESSERCTTTPSNLGANQWQNFNISVPVSAVPGTTRMRVRETFANVNIDPCQNYSYGECEDFTVYIQPNCPAGYRLWLGFTPDWNDPANWCGGIPSRQDSAVVSRNNVPGIGGRPYYFPVIGSGMKASTKGLLISSQDTLLIDAMNPADTVLRIHGGLHNNGKLIVRDGNVSTIPVSNGTLENSIYTPFRGGNTDARCQILYSAAELTSMGFTANTAITDIGFNVIPITQNGLPGKNSAQPYTGFTISYGLISGNTIQFAGTTPVGTPNVVFGPVSFSTVSGNNQIHLNSPIVWDGTSSLVIQYCFNNVSTTGNDLLKITQTTGRKTCLLLTASTANVAPGCALVPGAGVSDNFFASAGINRPNFTFTTGASYGKPLIALKGSLTNNGIFEAGGSQFIMESGPLQLIQGSSVTTFHELKIHKNSLSNKVRLHKPIIVSDTLYLTMGQLVMNKKTITLDNAAATSGSAASGSFSGPITRTGGLIISEDSLSKVKWRINALPSGNANGLYRVIPFGTKTLEYIPFSFRHISGNLGTFQIATYTTSNTNQPYPPTVFHMNDTGAVAEDNSDAAVDRFWITSKGINAAAVDFCFRYSALEKNSVSPVFNALSNPARVYPWRVDQNGTGTWLKLYNSPANVIPLATANAYTQTYSSGASSDSVVIRNFNWPNILAGPAPWNTTAGPMPDYIPWAIAGSSNAGALGSGSHFIAVLDSVISPCNSATGAIYISVINGIAPFTYNWSNGSSTQDQTGLFAGTYNVIVTDASGASVSLQVVLNNTSPLTNTPGQIAGPVFGVCGATATYSIAPVNNANTYQWIVPAGASITGGQGSTSITVNFPFNYAIDTIQVAAGNVCGYGPFKKLTVRGRPGVPGPVSGPSTACNGQSGMVFSITPVYGATNYIWNKPAGTVINSGQGTTNASMTFGPNSGNVTVKASNACGTSGNSTKSVTVNCRIEEPANISYKVFPNPSEDDFHFEGDFSNGPVGIELYDMNGKLILSRLVDESFDFGKTLDAGLYILHIEADHPQRIRIVKL